MSLEGKLASYLMRILDAEKTIELHRQNLARIPSFNPYSAFRKIDSDFKKYITDKDIKLFLIETNANFSENTLNEVFKQYDSDRNGIINYQEFLNFILTRNDLELRAVETQRETSGASTLSYESIVSLKNLFEKELQFFDLFIENARELKSLDGFSTIRAFKAIDYLNIGYIDFKGIELFLRSQGYFLSSSDIRSLLGRLDRDNDFQVNISEFEDIFFLGLGLGSTNFKQSGFNKSDTLSYSKTFNQKEIEQNNSLNESIRMTGFRDKSHYSPLRDSFISVNKRANLETYTSPRREVNFNRSKVDEYSKLNSYSPQKYQLSPKKEVVLASPERRNIENLRASSNYTYNNYSPRKTTSNYQIRSIDRFTQRPSNELYRNESIIIGITRFFNDLIQIENRLEQAKENFILNQDARVNEIFNIFDKYSIGEIGIFDFKEALLKFDVFITLEEIKLVFKRYDSDQDQKLRYNEFCSMILPKSYEHLRISQRISYGIDYNMSYETKFKLVKLLRLIIETEKSVELLRQYLSNNNLFNIYDAFNIIKSRYSSSISKQDIKQFLNENTVFFTPLELELIYDRFDKDFDGKISLSEFTSEISYRKV